jgi:hypothetical protein
VGTASVLFIQKYQKQNTLKILASLTLTPKQEAFILNSLFGLGNSVGNAGRKQCNRGCTFLYG